MSGELAIISDAGFVSGQDGGVTLDLTVNMLGGPAIASVPFVLGANFVSDASICNVYSIEGMACIVETIGDHVQFVELFKPVAQLQGEQK